MYVCVCITTEVFKFVVMCEVYNEMSPSARRIIAFQDLIARGEEDPAKEME